MLPIPPLGVQRGELHRLKATCKLAISTIGSYHQLERRVSRLQSARGLLLLRITVDHLSKVVKTFGCCRAIRNS